MFENKDFIFANLECAITESDEKIAKYGPYLKAPYEVAEVLTQIGIDCVGLSNNHVFDYGKEGIRDTLKALESNGIAYTGFGENYRAVSNAFTESSSEFQNGLFSHYLDCEAHTDVWREICPSLNFTNCINDD